MVALAGAAEHAALHAPVAVIGAGPAGLVTSLLLSKYRIRHLLIEKYPTMAHTPRAHIINQRTVEILRDLGLEDDFRQIAMAWPLMENCVWHVSLSGLELARRRSWGAGPDRHVDYTQSSPCEMANCGQHLLEPMLLDAAQKSEFAEVRLNYELVALEQDPAGVDATIRQRITGQELRVRSDYLVGADGGRSPVAAAIGLDYDGEEGLAASATIHFHADLERFVAHRPGALYWNAVPGLDGFRGAGTLICHQPWHDWALAFSYDPEKLAQPTDEGLAMARLRKVIGDDSVAIDIKNIGTWTINRLVAREYSVGRVFCMGDAVHRHPPTNGLGLNTSVADAYNLAWKLALVVDGRADPALLGSYSQERQPVGRQIVERAYASIGDTAALREAFGFDSAQSEEEGEEAIALLHRAGPDGEARREMVAATLAGTDYQFNAHGVEVGYRYRNGATVPDGTPEPPFTRDPELYDHPSTWPGAHLPHAWLDDGNRQLSTGDIVGPGAFTLITGIGGDGWIGAAAEAARSTGDDVDVRFVGTADGYIDCYGDWRRLREVADSGCVLVRPDRFVAWQARDDRDESLQALPGVVATLLGRGSR
jgi:2,4-dichlorophenol 6-monooxygenase